MASERIGDERLDAILAIALWARDNDMGVELPHEDAESMATELRSRRARDLTAEEREVLDGLRLFIRSRFGANHIGQAQVAALDKLLATDGGDDE